jgi:hypothetical protein
MARIPIAFIGLGIGLLVIVRLSLLTDEFDNPDIAGIAYNADMLLRGGLPYRDTVELKPPGTFFLFAATFKLLGRSLVAVQLVYAGWLLCGAPAVWIAAKILYGEHRLVGRHAPAIATFAYLLSAGAFDYNYASWMTPPFVWAFALALVGFVRSSARWHTAAGAAAMVAFLMKGQGIVIAPVLLMLWVWARRRAPTRGARLPFLAWSIGAFVVFLPLLVLYAAAGAVPPLLDGVFPFVQGASYASNMQSPVPWYTLVRWGAWQLATVFPLASAAVVATLVGYGLDRRDGITTSDVVPGLALFSASFVGVLIGGPRLYNHHLVQYLPALALLAAHPSAWARLVSGPRGGIQGAIRVVATTILGSLLVFQLVEIARGDGHRYDAKARRLDTGTTPAQAAGRHIRERTDHNETIMVWGWTAWPVYFWAHRTAPTPAFKPLGTLTDFNTNSMFFPGRPIAFRPGKHADALVQAFRERPPAYFVLSPSFVTTFGSPSDPIEGFTELVRELETQYMAEAQFGDLLLLRRMHPSRVPRSNEASSH